jgi:DHA1 family tetracycline resistance protein-like MFS transporter
VVLVGYAVAPGWLVLPVAVIGALSSIGAGAVQAWLSERAGADEQGTVQGALTGIASLAELGVPVAATALFAWSLGIGAPGLVLLVAAGLSVGSALTLAFAD